MQQVIQGEIGGLHKPDILESLIIKWLQKHNIKCSGPRRITKNKIKPLIFRGFSSYPKALFPFYSPLNMNNRKNYIVYLQQSAMKQECQDPK
jgi:hypothetical protein